MLHSEDKPTMIYAQLCLKALSLPDTVTLPVTCLKIGPVWQPLDSYLLWPIWHFPVSSLESNGDTCVVGFVHGSSSSEASRRGSVVNKQMDLVFYLFLTGVREVTEPSDTSTTNGFAFGLNICVGRPKCPISAPAKLNSQVSIQVRAKLFS